MIFFNQTKNEISLFEQNSHDFYILKIGNSPLKNIVDNCLPIFYHFFFICHEKSYAEKVKQ